jgi:deoxyribodipyrimidine photo-lyase
MTGAPAVSISLSGICLSLRSAPFLQVQSTLGTLILQDALARLHIPLHVSLHLKRRTLPSHVISLLQSVNAIRLFANIEYEVDELRRDITVCHLAKDKGILPNFFHDKLIVEPGLLSTKQGKPFSVCFYTLVEDQK